MRPWVRLSAPTLKWRIAAPRARAALTGLGISANRSGRRSGAASYRERHEAEGDRHAGQLARGPVVAPPADSISHRSRKAGERRGTRSSR